MRTLQQAIEKMEKGAGQSLKKHLGAVGITTWKDITRSNLFELRDYLADELAPGTQKTVLAYLKSVLNRVKEEIELPADFAKILSVKATRPMKIYLTESDLSRLEGAPIHTNRQAFVKNVFLICAYTGLRVGDAMNLTPENVVDGCLRYTAKKTRKANQIPLKRGLEERIAWVASHQEFRVTRAAYNKAVRKMCKDAGINEEVVVFKAGKEMKGPKWMFVSSHTARISTASCLNRRGVSIGDIQTILQHSSITQTERYIVRDRVQLSKTAMRFFS